MKKILLVKPSPTLGTYVHSPPLGIMTLSAYLKERILEINIKIVDLSMNDTSFKNIVSQFNPDIVGLSITSPEHNEMLKMANTIKDLNSNIICIAGGPHPTAFYDEVLECNNIDFAVIGEGEETLYNLVKNWIAGKDLKNILGMAYRTHEQTIIFNGHRDPVNINTLPIPDWKSINITEYTKRLSFTVINAGKRPVPIFTSRGCPYHCVYCHSIFGKKFRFRTPESVIDEIKYLVNVHNVDEIMIYDDIFNLDRKRVKTICNLIISNNIKIKISFPNAIRGDLLDEEVIELLKRAGVYILTIAIETGSERLQKLVKKNINLPKIQKIIDIAYEKDIALKAFFMIGFPTETKEEIEKTIKIALNKKITFIGIFIVTPQKNCELYKMVEKYYPDYKPSFNYHHYFSENPGYENVVNLPLRTIQRNLYLRFYLNPIRVLRIIKLIPSLYSLAKGLLCFTTIVIKGFRKNKPKVIC